MRTLLSALIVAVVSSMAPALAAEIQPLLVAQAKAELIDINRAKTAELMTLKGIGEARPAQHLRVQAFGR